MNKSQALGTSMLELIVSLTILGLISTGGLASIASWRASRQEKCDLNIIRFQLEENIIKAGKLSTTLEIKNFKTKGKYKIKSKDNKIGIYYGISCSPALIKLLDRKCGLSLSLRCRIRSTC